MPYKNILWIKLEKRLLNDHRFYLLSEKAQLIYIKLLLLSAETQNKMPKSSAILKACFRATMSEDEIVEAIKEIKNNFPKFKESPRYYYFSEWKNRVNQLRKDGYSKDSPSIAKEYAWDRKDKIREDKIRKEKEKGYSSFKKPYFRGMQMRKKGDKWWCIPNDGGQWLEFVGKQQDIVWK